MCEPMTLTMPNYLFSDFGFRMSEDLSLEVCVPDPGFSGQSFSPPVPCPVGSTYRRTRGWVSGMLLCQAHRNMLLDRAESYWEALLNHVLELHVSWLHIVWATFKLFYIQWSKKCYVCELLCNSGTISTHKFQKETSAEAFMEEMYLKILPRIVHGWLALIWMIVKMAQED